MPNGTEQAATDIVVVDDDTLVLELVRRLLRGTDYDVQLFSDQAEALEYLQGHQTSVLIVDHRMPRISGLELLTTLATSGNLTSRDVFLCSAAELPDAVLDEAGRLGVTAMSKELFSDKTAFLASLGNCVGLKSYAKHESN